MPTSSGDPQGWHEVVNLPPSGPAGEFGFGYTVKLSGGTAIEGSRQGPMGGIAYTFDRAYPVLDDSIVQSDWSVSSLTPRRSVVIATYANVSDVPIRNPFFEATSIGVRSVPLNGDGPPAGVGATLSPDVGDGILSPGESTSVDFVIRHPRGRRRSCK